MWKIIPSENDQLNFVSMREMSNLCDRGFILYIEQVFF